MVEARVDWLKEERFIGAASSGHGVVVDGGPAKIASSPMELVLIGLCGCTAIDVVSILRKKREAFTALSVRAEAERAPEPPTVYTRIHLVYTVTGPVSHKAVEDAVRLSQEKYCSVSAMVAKTAAITTSVEYAP